MVFRPKGIPTRGVILISSKAVNQLADLLVSGLDKEKAFTMISFYMKYKNIEKEESSIESIIIRLNFKDDMIQCEYDGITDFNDVTFITTYLNLIFFMIFNDDIDNNNASSKSILVKTDIEDKIL